MLTPRRCSAPPSLALGPDLRDRPEFPPKGFADLAAAREWVVGFVQWYNHDHRHSGIRYVTPAQRHAGEDRQLLDARHALYQAAREHNPRRWSRQTRDWTPIEAVTLNPERDAVVQAALAKTRLPGSAGAPASLSRPDRVQAAERDAGQEGSGPRHRTLPAVSTVAGSRSTRGSLRRSPAQPEPRHR